MGGMVRETMTRLMRGAASLVELPLLLDDDLLEQPTQFAMVRDGEQPLESLPPLANYLIGRRGLVDRDRLGVKDQLRFGASCFLLGGLPAARGSLRGHHVTQALRTGGDRYNLHAADLADLDALGEGYCLAGLVHTDFAHRGELPHGARRVLLPARALGGSAGAPRR